MISLCARLLCLALLLTLVARAEPLSQFDYVVVGKEANGLKVRPACEMCRKADHACCPECMTGAAGSVTFLPRASFIKTLVMPNQDEYREMLLTQQDFLEQVRVGDVVEVEGTGSEGAQQALAVWLHRPR